MDIWVTVDDTALQANKPWRASQALAFNQDLRHLREWIGQDYYAGAAANHNHDGVNSAKVDVATNIMVGGQFEGANGADPTGWTKTVYTGGTVALNTSAQKEGASCLAITSTSTTNGGGNALQDSYEPVMEGRYYEPFMGYYATVANVPCKISIIWYDSAQAQVSETILVNLTNTPTSITEYTGGPIQAPSTARYARARVELPTGGSATGTVYFDGGILREASLNVTISQAMLGAAAVGQAELKTTTGAVSGSQLDYTLPGGEYGFYPTTRTASTTSTYWAMTIGGPGGTGVGHAGWTTYRTNISFVNSINSTHYAQQRYVQASPPYNLGNGDIAVFIFVEIDKTTGDVVGSYVAQDPPWANNGPTSIRPDYIDHATGKKYRNVRKVIRDYGNIEEARLALTPAKLAKRMATDKIVKIEIDQAFKQSDMPLIPHPFTEMADRKIVLLDPVGSIVDQLGNLADGGGAPDIAEMLHGNYLTIGNTDIGATAPPGVMPVSASFK